MPGLSFGSGSSLHNINTEDDMSEIQSNTPSITSEQTQTSEETPPPAETAGPASSEGAAASAADAGGESKSARERPPSRYSHRHDVSAGSRTIDFTVHPVVGRSEMRGRLEKGQQPLGQPIGPSVRGEQTAETLLVLLPRNRMRPLQGRRPQPHRNRCPHGARRRYNRISALPASTTGARKVAPKDRLPARSTVCRHGA